MTNRYYLGEKSSAINQAILDAITEKPGITRARLAKVAGVTNGCVAGRIRRFRSMGLVRQEWRGAPFPASYWPVGES